MIWQQKQNKKSMWLFIVLQVAGTEGCYEQMKTDH